MTERDPLARFRRMLDRDSWPIGPDDSWLIIDGEIFCYERSADPEESRVFRPLFRRFQ